MVEKNEVLFVYFANSASKYKIIEHRRGLNDCNTIYAGSGAHIR